MTGQEATEADIDRLVNEPSIGQRETETQVIVVDPAARRNARAEMIDSGRYEEITCSAIERLHALVTEDVEPEHTARIADELAGQIASLHARERELDRATTLRLLTLRRWALRHLVASGVSAAAAELGPEIVDGSRLLIGEAHEETLVAAVDLAPCDEPIIDGETGGAIPAMITAGGTRFRLLNCPRCRIRRRAVEATMVRTVPLPPIAHRIDR